MSKDVSEEWRDGALCATVDPQLFFPETTEEAKVAKQLCRTCDVVEQCLQYALAKDEQYGIWGAKSPNERRALLRYTRRIP